MDKTLPINVRYPKGEDAINLVWGGEFKCQEKDPETQEMIFSPSLQKEMYQTMESIYVVYQKKLRIYTNWFNLKHQGKPDELIPDFPFPDFEDWVCYVYPKFGYSGKKILGLLGVTAKDIPSGVTIDPPPNIKKTKKSTPLLHRFFGARKRVIHSPFGSYYA